MQKGNVSDGEFEAARAALGHSFRQIYDSPLAISRFYTGRMLAGISESIEEWGEKIHRVTKEEVIEAARQTALGAVYAVMGTKEEVESDG